MVTPGAAARRWPPTRWRCRRLPRVPAARARARRPAQDVHRHADAGAGAGGVRRAAAGGRARQPAGAAAAAAGRGRARRWRSGDLSSKPVFASRDELGGLTRSFAAHDRAARPRRASWCSAAWSQLEGARTQPADHPRQPDRRRDRVRPRRRASTPSTRAPRASCGCRCRPTAAGRLDEVPGLDGFAQAVWQRFELHAASPEAGERDHWQDSFELQTGGRRAASATRSRCWCAARRCRRARG